MFRLYMLLNFPVICGFISSSHRDLFLLTFFAERFFNFLGRFVFSELVVRFLNCSLAFSVYPEMTLLRLRFDDLASDFELDF